MDQQAWTQAHVEAFAFFGGVTARLVPDNLRTGVDRPDLYDPKISRSYAELAAHYDTLVDLRGSANPRTRPASNGRCPMSGTRLARAAVRRAGGCSRPRSCGAPTSPGSVRVARSVARYRSLVFHAVERPAS